MRIEDLWTDYYTQLERSHSASAASPWNTARPDPPPADPRIAAPYWVERRDFRRALMSYNEALARYAENDDTPLAYDFYRDCAWLLATCPDPACRDGLRAVRLAHAAWERLERLRWNEPKTMDTLAAAYAENGNYVIAAQWARRAANGSSRDPFVQKAYAERLDLYRRRLPFRESE